jgi:hypothetical protein
MPTLLEWTRAQHIGFAGGGTLCMFGLIGGLMRWMKVSV